MSALSSARLLRASSLVVSFIVAMTLWVSLASPVEAAAPRPSGAATAVTASPRAPGGPGAPGVAEGADPRTLATLSGLLACAPVGVSARGGNLFQGLFRIIFKKLKKKAPALARKLKRLVVVGIQKWRMGADVFARWAAVKAQRFTRYAVRGLAKVGRWYRSRSRMWQAVIVFGVSEAASWGLQQAVRTFAAVWGRGSDAPDRRPSALRGNLCR